MKKIVYVDDDEKTLRVVSRFLRERGYQVITSTVPFIAGLLKDENPDLILLDINMPLLSGDKLVQVLRKHDYAAANRVFFYSGQGPEALRKAVKDTGAAGALSKDAGLEMLFDRIKDVIGAP